MPKKLNAQEVVTLMQTIVTSFRMLTEGPISPVAGIIFTNDTYDSCKRLFGPEARPYIVSGIDSDPAMENSFVVAGMLCLRGTPMNEGGTSPLVLQ